MANGRDIDFIGATVAVTIVTITFGVITTSEGDADASSLGHTLSAAPATPTRAPLIIVTVYE